MSDLAQSGAGPGPGLDYDALPGLRWSQLAKLRRSPKAFREQVIERTASLDMGTALHALTSGDRVVCAYPGPTRRGKEWEAFRRTHAGDIIVTNRELDLVERMGGALLKHEQARDVLRRTTRREVLIQWQLADGRAAKAKLDGTGSELFWDLKSTRDIGSRAWGRDIAARGYVHQLAWYRRAYRVLWPNRPQVLIVAVENVSPHDVRVDEVEHDLLDAADRDIDRLLTLHAECERTQQWPGLAPGLGELASLLPPWWCDDDAASEITLDGETVHP